MDETLAVSLNCLLHKLFKSQYTFSVMVIFRKSRRHFFWLFTEFLFNCINLNLILDAPLGREGLEWDSEVPEASSNKGKQSRDIVQYLSVWSSGCWYSREESDSPGGVWSTDIQFVTRNIPLSWLGNLNQFALLISLNLNLSFLTNYLCKYGWYY